MICKKRSYNTKEEAVYVIKQIHIQNALKPTKRAVGEQSYYYCAEHKAWHITSQYNKKNKVKDIDDIKKIVQKEKENEEWKEKFEKNKRLRF